MTNKNQIKIGKCAIAVKEYVNNLTEKDAEVFSKKLTAVICRLAGDAGKEMNEVEDLFAYILNNNLEEIIPVK